MEEPGTETDLADFLVALGEAMVDAGDPVTHVRSSLERVARASGAEATEVVVLATALFVSVPGATVTHTAVASAGARPLRLDQVDDLFGPPAIVSFLPAFWLLVPGSLGLLGVTKYFGEDRVYGAASLISAGATMVAIALGVLLGLTAGSRTAERPH